MGVRGLTTYIKANGRKFLKVHNLHNCHIILDGYSIATNLFINLHSETAFGGNYDVYALYIKDFFKLLKKCQIKPLVVFDGGYERRKIRTVYQRMKSKISSARNVNLQGATPNFPLFMRHIFREVLVELQIPFAQCDFEADVEIAALARELHCPVLSYDSDFYIFDVMYIPFPSLSLEALPMEETDTSQEKKYYLKCKLYVIDNFLNRFGGLDRTMLPLLATVLGNDYIKRSVFSSFFEQFKIPRSKKKNPSQVRIAALLEWLRNESLETALCKILGRMKRHRRRLVAFKVKSVIKGYTKFSSVMDSYLSIQTEKNGEVNELDVNQIINQIESTTVAEEEEEVEENCCNSDSNCEGSEEEIEEDCEIEKEEDSDTNELDQRNDEDINVESENEEIVEIPDWLIDSMRKGNIHSSIMDILTLRTYFCPIQVEDYSLSHSHRLSLPILSVIVGLLLGRDQRIRYWARNISGRLEWFSLDSVTETKTVKFPHLELLNQVPLCERRLILLETLDLDIDLDLFPSNWQLFVVAVLYWLKNMTEPVVTISHLHTLVMCIVSLQVLYSKIGCYHTRKDFMRKYSRYVKKLNLSCKTKIDVKLSETKENKDNGVENSETNVKEERIIVPEEENQKDVNNKENCTSINLNCKPRNIAETLSSVTKEDCILMFDTLLSFHRLNDQLRIKPKLFCIMSVHSFAIFQSCLHHIMLLNSILNFPLKQCFISKFYSGMFAYNVFSEISTKKNVDMYMRHVFKSSPSLLSLYETVFKTLSNILPPDHLAFNPIKNRRKKKKGRSKVCVSEVIANLGNETEEEEVFLDENNKFSLLAIS